MPWKNKHEWTSAQAPATGRRSGKSQIGFQGDHVQPTDYRATYGSFPTSTPRLPNGAYAPDVDVPNLQFVHWVQTGSPPFPSARNKAWSDLVASLRGDTSQLLVALGEFRTSSDMIGNRALQMYHGYRDLRQGRFRQFLARFGLEAKRKHRNLIKSKAGEASGLWLEYSFGWKPLAQDMYNATQVMSGEPPGGRVHGFGHENFSLAYTNKFVSERYTSTGRCNMIAFVHVDNPALFLNQTLGLINPALVAWELVPFSFMVDWATDIGTFLSAMTDFLGLAITRSSTSYAARARVGQRVRWPFTNPPQFFELEGEVATMVRTTGLDFPFPNLKFASNIGESKIRAANAVALLVQILSGQKPDGKLL